MTLQSLPAPRALTAVSADGTPVHVEVYGPEGAPAVVLSHGWTCSIAFWAEQIRALAADHRVIAYDQRGHGRSPRPPPPAARATPRQRSPTTWRRCSRRPSAPVSGPSWPATPWAA